jgi:hypothetical protein
MHAPKSSALGAQETAHQATSDNCTSLMKYILFAATSYSSLFSYQFMTHVRDREYSTEFPYAFVMCTLLYVN